MGNLPIKENQGTPIEISNIYLNPTASFLTMSWSYNLDDLVHESIVIHIVEFASCLIKKDISTDFHLRSRNTIDIIFGLDGIN